MATLNSIPEELKTAVLTEVSNVSGIGTKDFENRKVTAPRSNFPRLAYRILAINKEWRRLAIQAIFGYELRQIGLRHHGHAETSERAGPVSIQL